MRGMIPSDIGLLRQATAVQLSPDGSSIAFTVVSVDLDGNEYRSRIWLAPTDGSSRPRPFTSGEARDGLPRWSPDGRVLAFISHRDDKGSQVLVIPVTVSGETVVVSSWPEEVTELAWSPDGERLAFVARDRDEARYGTAGETRRERDMPPRHLRRMQFRLDNEGWIVDRPKHVFVVPADGSAKPFLVTPGEHEAEGVTWSPDGSRLAFVSARHDSRDLDAASDLWITTPDGGDQPRKLTETVASYSLPSWAPDARQLAYLRNPTPMDEPRHNQVGVINVDSCERLELTTWLDRNCAPFPGARSPVWEGEHVAFAIEDAGNVHLYRVPADGTGKPEVVVGGDRWVAAWDAAAGAVAFASTTPTCLAEVVTARAAGGERQLTDFTGPFAATVQLLEPERFVASSPDGTEVECWAMPPTGVQAGRRYPTLLNIHGGPFTQYGNKLFDEFQVQAGAGFGVLYCNPRGSSGYSEAFGRAIRWPEADSDPGSGWGGVDYDDIMACVEEASRRFGWIDADRLGVLGGSYGGYMTSWIIGHTDRFKAACSERACNNLLTLDQNSDMAGFFASYVGKSHVDDAGAFLRQSPISYVKDMVTPVLIVHSENDLRCPVNQGEELFVALRLLGRQPEMVRFPGEGHELSRSGSPRHRVMRAELILDWFRRQLGDPS